MTRFSIVSIVLLVMTLMLLAAAASCFAWEDEQLLPQQLPPQSQTTSRLHVKRRLENSNITFQVKTLDAASSTTSTTSSSSTCPVCKKDKETDRAIQRIYSRASSLVKRTSTFDSLQRSLRTRIGRRRYHKLVSTNSTVFILNSTGSHFAALANRAKAKATGNKDDTIANDMFNLLQDVATVSGSVSFELANVLRGGSANRAATAGLLTTSTLAMLGYLDRVTLATTSLLADHVTTATSTTATLTGPKSSTNGAMTLQRDYALQDMLSANATNGVFGDVLNFLTKRGDTSGLVTVLTKLSRQVSSLHDRVLALSLSSNKTNSAVLMTSDTVHEISAIMAGITLTSVNSMQRMALVGKRGLVSSTLGLWVQHINSIQDQAMSTARAVVRLVQIDQPNRAKNADDSKNAVAAAATGDSGGESGVNVSGDTLAFIFFCAITAPICIPILFLTSPIWLSVIYFYNLLEETFGDDNDVNSKSSRRRPLRQYVKCQRDRLVCQSKVISAALPSV